MQEPSLSDTSRNFVRRLNSITKRKKSEQKLLGKPSIIESEKKALQNLETPLHNAVRVKNYAKYCMKICAFHELWRVYQKHFYLLFF